MSNLLPVRELPRTVFPAQTPLRDKTEIQKYSDKLSHPAFVLREGRLWTFENLRTNGNAFERCVRIGTVHGR